MPARRIAQTNKTKNVRTRIILSVPLPPTIPLPQNTPHQNSVGGDHTGDQRRRRAGRHSGTSTSHWVPGSGHNSADQLDAGAGAAKRSGRTSRRDLRDGPSLRRGLCVFTAWGVVRSDGPCRCGDCYRGGSLEPGAATADVGGGWKRD